jgi:prolyl 4-hydroxylase
MDSPLDAAGLDLEFQAMARARHAGNPGELAALGVRLITGHDAPRAPTDGLALLNEAAAQGSAHAWHLLAVLAAAGAARKQDWGDAFAALEKAAALGHKPARRERQILSSLGITSESTAAHWIARAGNPRVLHPAPRFAAHAGLLPLALCKYLIELATPHLKRAQVFDAATGTLKTDPMRTNQTAAFSIIDSTVVMQLMRARIAQAAGVEFAMLEPLEVLHYQGGELYRPHIDFFHPSRPNYDSEMRLRGQRVKTCLVYLNGNYEGGETDFPKLGIRFRGEVGEALVFDSVNATGEGDMNTLHAGLPPASGIKWLLSQWIREKAQPVA